MAKVETRYGSMLVPDIQDDVVGRFLARYGEWSSFEIVFAAANLPGTGARIADIGAFVGTFGIGLSQTADLAAVCFVEANGAVAPLLQANVSANCRAPSQVIEALVGPDTGETRRAFRYAGNQGSVSFVPRDAADLAADVAPPAKSIRLKELWDAHGPFDLIKMDVEGMEFAILDDARELLRDPRFAVWAECNEDRSALDLADLLLAQGLKVFYFAFPSFNPDNFRGDPDPVFPFAYEAGLFASHGDVRMDAALQSADCLFEPILDREHLRAALWKTPRWCPPEIVSRQPETSLALAIRALQGERYASFLIGKEATADVAEPQALAWSPVADLREIIESAEKALQYAEQLVAERTAERDDFGARLDRSGREVADLRAERDQLNDRLQDAIGVQAWLQSLADDRLKLLRAERDRAEAESRLHEEQARIRADIESRHTALRAAYSDLEAAHRAIAQSTTWRATRLLRATIGRLPWLRSIVRLAARPVVRLLRPAQGRGS